MRRVLYMNMASTFYFYILSLLVLFVKSEFAKEMYFL